mmetsp:Transcript_70705/g.183502  ORF Transcript_70705/g.183502 Transcript_70705/m.183502 type:complete len:173 (+) Transcript_70705:69-587(+)
MSGPAGEGQWGKELRSKGLLPAVGVGAAVYFVTGLVSLSTLGLVGIGAGVGYGVGGWLADAYQKKQDEKNGGKDPVTMDQLPWAMQVSLQAWQAYLQSKAQAGIQLTPQQIEMLFNEFEQIEPAHANNVRALVHAAGQGQQPGAASSSSGMGSTPVMQSPGTYVVPTRAAEV